MKRLTFLLALVFAVVSVYAQKAEEGKTEVDQYGVEVTSVPVNASEEDGILVFRNDKGYKLWFDTRIQTDFATFFGEDPNFDAIGDGASIRRARFAVKANITPDWYGEIDMDFANGSFELKDALIRYTGFKGFELQVGNFKPNYNIQYNTTSRYLMFIERPMIVSTLAPGRHIGFNAKYSNKFIWASAGVFFQEIEGQETRTYVEDNNKDYGRSEGLSYIGKVIFRPINEKDASLHIGVSWGYMKPETAVSPSDYGSTRLSTRATTSINRKKYLDTDLIKNTDNNIIHDFEIAGHYKGLRVEGAYLSDAVNLTDDATLTYGDDYDGIYFDGFYAQASYLLFGGTQTYDSNGAKYTKINAGKKWGDLEFCIRYEYANLNDFDAGIYGGSAEGYAAGLNLYLGKNMKFQLNYQFTNNDRYANGKGKLYVGYDVDGNPTKDYTKVVAEDGKAGVDFSSISCRFQLAF
ncbi:MAG: porin [Bacteroidales bacterium]|nr:porin [Bacteroidales bacterium]MDD2204229.1 porin [Bacteroidales bacterium]MDD3913598.1 porin [Bacteroidales bacterium]MDD4633634.1 porin [Bacteroidales bacterium]